MKNNQSKLQPLDELRRSLKMCENDKKSIESIAQVTAKNILQNISQVSKKIEESKQLVRAAENAKSDWSSILSGGMFGRSATDKKTDINTRAISQQSEAIIEMQKLIQESVKLTCCSVFFAKTMTRTISHFLVKGFKDVDGRQVQLGSVAKENAEFLLQQAEDFMEHQMENEKRQEEQDFAISELQEGMREKDLLDEQQSKDIGQNTQDIEDHKREIQGFHLRLKDKENIDNAQEQEIKNLKTKIEDLQEQINKKSSFVPYLISTLSLVVAIVSLVLNFIDFKI